MVPVRCYSPMRPRAGKCACLCALAGAIRQCRRGKGGLLWSGPMVLGENGIGKLDRTKLDQLMNGRRLELSFGVDNDAFEFTSTTRVQDMADQLTLIATKMAAPVGSRRLLNAPRRWRRRIMTALKCRRWR